jgi:hypothetical protein
VRSLPHELEPGYPAENERVMRDHGEIGYFHERCSDLMRELLAGLAEFPDEPRPFPEVEDALGWPHRRIASVLGGVSHLRHAAFGGRRPYHFLAPRRAASGRWEIWMDAEQARAVHDARAADSSGAYQEARSTCRSRGAASTPTAARATGSRAPSTSTRSQLRQAPHR